MTDTRPPAYWDADLVLRLYDLRREEKLRAARAWLGTFSPASGEELYEAYLSPDNVYLRMVAGYWDMAAALVNQGILHRGLFFETGGEAFFLWAKLGEFVPRFRELSGSTTFLAGVERLIRETPGGPERVASMREIQKKIRAEREARANAKRRARPVRKAPGPKRKR